jgi:hypothetical protein
MPSYRGHVAAGCCTFIGILLLFHKHTGCLPVTWTELFLFTLIGSLFPDIDTKSKGQQLVYALNCLLVIYLIVQRYFFAALSISLCCFLPLISKHRGIFHNPLFLLCGISSVVAILLNHYPLHNARILYDALFFLCGVASHIALDRLVCGTKSRWPRRS